MFNFIGNVKDLVSNVQDMAVNVLTDIDEGVATTSNQFNKDVEELGHRNTELHAEPSFTSHSEEMEKEVLLAGLQEQHKAILSENLQLRNLIESLERTRLSDVEMKAELVAKVANFEADISEYQEQARQLENANDTILKLQNHIHNLQDELQHKEEEKREENIENLQKIIEVLQSQNVQLQEQLTASSNSSVNIDTLSRELKKLKEEYRNTISENRRLQQAVLNAEQSRNDETKANTDLLAKVDNLEHELLIQAKKFSKDLEELEDSKKELEVKITSTFSQSEESEHERLNADLKEKHKAILSENLHLRNLTNSLEQIRLADVETKAELVTKVKNLETDVSVYQEQARQLENTNEKILKLQNHVQNLQDELQKKKEMEHESAQQNGILTKIVKELKSENAELQEQLLANSNSVHEEEYQFVVSENLRLKQAVENAEQRQADETKANTNLLAKVNDLEHELRTHAQQFNKNLEELHERKDNMEAELVNKVANLEADIPAYQEQARQLEIANETISELQNLMHSLQDKLQQKEEEGEQTIGVQQVEHLQKIIEDLHSQNAELKEQVTACAYTSVDVDRLSRLLSELQEEHRNTISENRRLQQAAENAEQSRNDETKANTDLLAKVDNLEHELLIQAKKFTKELEELEERKKELEARLTSASHTEYMERDRLLAELQEQHSAVASENIELQKRAECMEERREADAEVKADLVAKMVKLEADISAYQEQARQLENANDTILKLQNHIHNLQDELQRKEGEMADLAVELEQESEHNASEFSDNQATLASLKSLLNSASAEAVELREKNEVVKRQLHELEKSVETKDLLISEITESRNVLLTKLAIAEEEIASLKFDLDHTVDSPCENNGTNTTTQNKLADVTQQLEIIRQAAFLLFTNDSRYFDHATLLVNLLDFDDERKIKLRTCLLTKRDGVERSPAPSGTQFVQDLLNFVDQDIAKTRISLTPVVEPAFQMTLDEPLPQNDPSETDDLKNLL